MTLDERAQKLGYTITRGAYHGTTDDRITDWYVQKNAGGMIDRRGRGFSSKAQALRFIESEPD